MRTLLALSALAACSTTANDPVAAPDAAEAVVCAPAGKLTIYAIAPAVALDWSTPNNLLGTVQASQKASKALVDAGAAAMTHSIGHVNLELDCGDDSIPLTGQTDRGASDLPAATNGAGLLLRDTPGALDHLPTGDRDETIADIQARQASGHVSRISFVVNHAMCTRLKKFVDEYIANGSYMHYDGALRPRRFEGAGCAIFGAGVIDVGGLLRRSVFTPTWARTEMIGSARIANFLGSGKYRYGGNLVARDAAGAHWIWPKGQDVPASASTPVWIGSTTLDAWNGPDDQPFGVPGLTGAMQTELPFTIYDPELMADWAEQVWADATANGSSTSLGVPWTPGTVGNAHEVTYDAHCVAPQTIGFADDNDDLFADSDAP